MEGSRVCFGYDENVPELDSGSGTQLHEHTKNHTIPGQADNDLCVSSHGT